MNYEKISKFRLIDSHIHLDKYPISEQEIIINDIKNQSSIDSLIAVSMDANSCVQNLKLAQSHSFIHPAFGFHPEQPLLTDAEFKELFSFMTTNQEKMIAVGEVGLPYYLRDQNKSLNYEPYIELLEHFIVFAKEYDKPIILHAVYEDAEIACRLLEKHSIHKAHFHWFKGSESVTERMISNGYYISVTPDCVYEKEIQTLIRRYPIEQIFVETDGPWPFTGPFKNKMTHPNMMHESIKTIARLKEMEVDVVYKIIFENTSEFYQL